MKELILEAVKARENSYSPYSGFRVGAALLAESGCVYSGANIECASYSATNCAERTAFFKAVSEGERKFLAIAIYGGFEGAPPDYCYPCGICRQIMVEFCNLEKFKIYVVKDIDNYRTYLLKELMPYGFGPANLGKIV